MKICLVTTIFSPELGGPAIYSSEVAIRLSSLGHEIHVVTYGTTPYESLGDIHVHRVAANYNIKSLSLIAKARKAAKEIIRIVNRHKIDVIYAQNPDLAGYPAYYASKATNIPYVIKFVGDWAWETSYRKGWTSNNLEDFYNSKGNLKVRTLKSIQRKILNNASLILVPSKHLEEKLRVSGVKTKILLINNAVDKIEVNKQKLPGFNIIMIGRLVAHKHFDKVIRLMNKIEGNLYIIGDGPERQKLESIVKELSLNNKVFLLGNLDHVTTLSHLSSASLLVLPSIYEGTSHVLLEAMLYKLPIITSNIPGNSELIRDNVSGLLFNKEDELLEKINMLKNNKALASKLTKNAYSQVTSKNTWQVHIKDLLSYFEQI